MEMFIGNKSILARPMNRLDYNTYRGWELPADENGEDEGFLVEYIDGGEANHPDHAGYISWSPKGVFERAYQSVDAMSFSNALVMLKAGYKIARAGWNGKNQFVVMMPGMYLPPFNTQGTERKVNDRTAKWIGEDKPLDCQPYCALYNAKGQWVPGWLASQGDLFAEDWCVVE